MTIIIQILRFAVAGLFIFSGLIKINDPVGTAIKLEEYFEIFAVDFASFFHFFIPFALPLAVLLCVAEVVLGVALLVGFWSRLTVWKLLGIIVFFTALTFYSAYFNKVTDCGCFGDAIKMTPWQSFGKDVALFFMIIVLAIFQKKLPQQNTRLALISTSLSLVLAFFIAIYAIRHEPPIDFRAYKVGNHIPSLRKSSVSCQYVYVMEKDGKQEEFSVYPTDTTYKFKSSYVANAEECKPKITDYSLWNDDGDFTEESLKGNKLVVIVKKVQDEKENFQKINQLLASVKTADKVVFTAVGGEQFEEFRHKMQLAAPYYFADLVLLKTIIRADPAILLLQDGTVKGKWHYNDLPEATQIDALLKK